MGSGWLRYLQRERGQGGSDCASAPLRGLYPVTELDQLLRLGPSRQRPVSDKKAEESEMGAPNMDPK